MTQVTTMETTETSLLALIKDYATYNMWANKRLVDWLRTKPAELLDKEVPSSFPSLKQTLVHILDVQTSWLTYIQYAQPVPMYGRVFEGSLEELFEGLTSQSEEFDDYIQSLDAEGLLAGRNFMAPVRWPEWDEFNRPGANLMMHALNHSTYHRGQLTTIGRNLGFTDAPMTDYMYYLLMAK